MYAKVYGRLRDFFGEVVVDFFRVCIQILGMCTQKCVIGCVIFLERSSSRAA